MTAEKIEAWIGDEAVIDFKIAKHWISLRDTEMEYAAPFGIATYNTVGAMRKIEWRPVVGAPAQ